MFHILLWSCQWPALLTGVCGSWLVSSKTNKQRYWGFFLWILSDIFLALYGLSDGGIGLVILQLWYIATSSRGMTNNKEK